jgi:hypothetical protein
MQEYITIVQELFPNWDAGASAASSGVLIDFTLAAVCTTILVTVLAYP